MYLLNFIVTLAFAEDMSTGKIPNRLFLCGMALAQAWSLYTGSVQKALMGLLGALVVVAIFLPLFMTGCIGAGDVKLLMIFPAFAGIRGTLVITAVSFAIGAVIGCIKLVYTGQFLNRMDFLAGYLRSVSQTGKIAVYDRPSSDGSCLIEQHRIHFSVPVFVSTALWIGGIIKI